MLMRVLRRLMPRDDRFIDRFCEHSHNVVHGAEAFRGMVAGDGRGRRRDA